MPCERPSSFVAILQGAPKQHVFMCQSVSFESVSVGNGLGQNLSRLSLEKVGNHTIVMATCLSDVSVPYVDCK